MRPPAAAAPAPPRAELNRPCEHRHHPPPRPSPPGQHRAAARRPQPPGRQPGLDTSRRTSYRHHRGATSGTLQAGLPRNHGKRNGEGRCHHRHGHGDAVQQPPHPEPAGSHQNDTVNDGTPLPRGHPQRRVTPDRNHRADPHRPPTRRSPVSRTRPTPPRRCIRYQSPDRNPLRPRGPPTPHRLDDDATRPQTTYPGLHSKGGVMYISENSIDTVIKWFNRPETDERILCLVAASTYKDMELLGRLFDSRGRISAKLGRDIALFMFAPEFALTDFIALDEEYGDLVIPGLARNEVSRKGEWRTKPADRVGPFERETVIQRSQGITDQIRQRFGLDRETLPCLVFLTRDNDTPFIVRTRDSADLGIIEQLLDELLSVAEVLRSNGMLDLPYSLAETYALLVQKSELDRKCEVERGMLNALITSTRDSLKNLGLDSMLDGLSPESAYSFFGQLGLGRDSSGQSPSYDTELVARITEAMRDARLYKQVGMIKSIGKSLRANTRWSAELSKEIEERRAREMSKETISEQLLTTEKKLEQICRQFEQKCRRRKTWRQVGLPVMEFIRIVARLTPMVNQVSTTAQQIETISSRLSQQSPGSRR